MRGPDVPLKSQQREGTVQALRTPTQSKHAPVKTGVAVAPGRTRPKPNPGKQRSFDAKHPLEVVITQVGGQWTIQPANNLKNTMLARLNTAEPNGQKLYEVADSEWHDRGHVAGKDHPPFIPFPPQHHCPIVMLEGEYVRITCDQVCDHFEISVGRDDDVNQDQDFPGPDNPFGWPPNTSATVLGGDSLLAQVSIPAVNGAGTPIQDGPREQRFFKFMAVVTFRDGTHVDVDPDGFCDR